MRLWASVSNSVRQYIPAWRRVIKRSQRSTPILVKRTVLLLSNDRRTPVVSSHILLINTWLCVVAVCSDGQQDL